APSAIRSPSARLFSDTAQDITPYNPIAASNSASPPNTPTRVTATPSNGPDVHVYMVAADDAKDVATVQKAGFVDLGVIKGNISDQNYTLASDLDLAKYRAVSIWCKRISVNFGAAALRPTQTSQNQ